VQAWISGRDGVKLVQRGEITEVGKSVAPWMLAATAEAIVEKELATPAEIDDAVAQLRAFLADPTTIVGDPRLFQVWAQRTSTETAA
jgi:hypothetical protein